MSRQGSIGESSPSVAFNDHSHSGKENSSIYNSKRLQRVEDEYLQHLAFLHNEYMEWCREGYTEGSQFWPDTIDDVYNKNTYAMSSLYHGDYPFDNLEDEHDKYLYVQVCIAQEAVEVQGAVNSG